MSNLLAIPLGILLRVVTARDVHEVGAMLPLLARPAMLRGSARPQRDVRAASVPSYPRFARVPPPPKVSCLAAHSLLLKRTRTLNAACSRFLPACPRLPCCNVVQLLSILATILNCPAA